jgi:hypothetical protein
MNTADDVVYPPSAPTITGNVTVTVKTIVGSRTVVDPSGSRVQLFYARDGREAEVTDATPPYTFTNVPIGIHAIRVTGSGTNDDWWSTIQAWIAANWGNTGDNSGSVSGSMVSQDTVIVRPGSTTAVELWF